MQQTDVRVGIALGGGFARGIAHLGVLQVLVNYGVPIHYVAGCSAGALVGAMFCAGLDPRIMQRVALKMNWRALVRLRLRRDGILDSSGLERFLRVHIGDPTFADLKVPFLAACTDLLTGEEVLVREGSVATAVRASAAFPGLFLPVKLGGRTLVDGGMLNNVPVRPVRTMGADVVIAVDLGASRPDAPAPKNMVGILLSALSLLQRPQIDQHLQEADVVIQPDLCDYGVSDLTRQREMVAVGREAARQALPAIWGAIARARARLVTAD
jgi:NTE family protein